MLVANWQSSKAMRSLRDVNKMHKLSSAGTLLKININITPRGTEREYKEISLALARLRNLFLTQSPPHSSKQGEEGAPWSNKKVKYRRVNTTFAAIKRALCFVYQLNRSLSSSTRGKSMTMQQKTGKFPQPSTLFVGKVLCESTVSVGLAFLLLFIGATSGSNFSGQSPSSAAGAKYYS